MADYENVLARLQTLCARAEYCQYDIYHKALKAMDGDSVLAKKLVDSLVKDNYIDDLRYASAFARDKSSITGWGPVKISYALSGKGIARETISEALADVDPAKASDKLYSVVSAKYRTLKGEDDAKLKLLKFALSRGYEYSSVAPVVERVISDSES